MVVDNVFSPPQRVLASKLVTGLIEQHRTGNQAVVAESVSLALLTCQYPQRNPGIDSDEVEGEPDIIGNLVSLDSRFAKIFSVRVLWARAGEVLDCAPQKVVFHFSNITRKPAFKGPAVSWHRDADNTYFASVGGRTLRFLLPLQLMSKITGGPEIVMGYHLSGAKIASLV